MMEKKSNTTSTATSRPSPLEDTMKTFRNLITPRALTDAEFYELNFVVTEFHKYNLRSTQCSSLLAQHIHAPPDIVWSVIRQFDKPQIYKHFIKSCSVKEGSRIAEGCTRDVIVISGLPAATSTERLDLLDDERQVMAFTIIGGEHRLRNYRAVMTVHGIKVEESSSMETIVLESYIVDVPEGNTVEDTQFFADTVVKLNLQKLASVTEAMARDGIAAAFFWINNDGKICILISVTRFLDVNEALNATWEFQHDSISRFSMVAKYSYRNCYKITCQIKTGMSSLGTMYAASLVLKHRNWTNHFQLTTVKWRTQELSVYSTHAAVLIEKDENTPANETWYKIKMWHFITHVRDAHFDIEIEEISNLEYQDATFLIQGIQFEPLQTAQHNHQESGSLVGDAYWEKKLPKDYQHYVYMSNNYLHYTTKKELYFLLCDGFLGYSGKLWFSLCKSTGGICSMLPASEILLSQNYDYQSLDTLSLSESKFGEVKKLKGTDEYRFTCKLRSPMFSRRHAYACHLVFKFADNNIQLDETRKSTICYSLDGDPQTIDFLNFNFLPSMNIPTIKQKNDYGLHDSTTKGIDVPDFRTYHAQEGWMQQRDDGWMEIILCKPLHKLKDRKLLEREGSRIAEGCTRDVIVIYGLLAATSTERLDLLDDARHVMPFTIIGCEHRLRNYRAVMTVHGIKVEESSSLETIVLDPYKLDVLKGNTVEYTQFFADTVVKLNLQKWRL
ncbi:hypothetical protein OSB04_029666 [Centaurea solstitialis]|uniref:Uncharacterized protein n=1 Tax=Centaurea solstitialis TaxID=347529 RepID=A0AA38SRG3_9ASTR|nr:hypothetical protein OSB04_029666 [Centaurea solstitialis]